MIIKGYISTDKGPIDIQDLKVGDKVLNQMHRAHPVRSIEKVQIEDAITFRKNKQLIIAKDTTLITLYGAVSIGDNKKKILTMMRADMKNVRDVIIPVKGEFTAYKLVIEGSDNVYVAGYCIKVEEYHA